MPGPWYSHAGGPSGSVHAHSEAFAGEDWEGTYTVELVDRDNSDTAEATGQHKFSSGNWSDFRITVAASAGSSGPIVEAKDTDTPAAVVVVDETTLDLRLTAAQLSLISNTVGQSPARMYVWGKRDGKQKLIWQKTFAVREAVEEAAP